MGYGNDRVVGQAPAPTIKPIQPNETPAFRAEVTRATSTASTLGQGTWSEYTKKFPDGRVVVGQRNSLTGEFKPYSKDLQPAAQPKLNPKDLADARMDALRRAVLAKQLETSSREDWFSTGFLAPTLSQYGGTAANVVVQNIDALRAGGALQTLLDAIKSSGKNPLTPMSTSDVQLLSNAKQLPLDVSMRDTDFQKNARQYYEANRRAFIAAGGSAKDFDAQVLRLTGRANSRASGIKVERIK